MVMGTYNTGEVWWTHFPYGDRSAEKRRPAIVLDSDTIAILAMYVTSKDKDTPFSVEIDDWESTGLKKPSWTRIDRIINIDEWDMDRKIGVLSDRDLTKILQLVTEFTSGVTHEFSIIAIQNSSGNFLQIYDTRWNCYLFPYTRSTDDNKANVDRFVSNLVGYDVNTTYVTTARHCKYSASDKVYKIYNHKLYEYQIKETEPDIDIPDLSDDIRRYRWMSIADMESDDTIMSINDDIVAFVKAKCKG